MGLNRRLEIPNQAKEATMDKLPEKILLKIFSYLRHIEIIRLARVCKKWRLVAYDSSLWKVISFRPEHGGLHVNSVEAILALISIRFGPSLRYIELPMELITAPVLHELATKCPNLTYLTLDFSSAMQLHDFNDLMAFPAHLRSLFICLSEVIFMEGFMRKIYNFLASVEVLHLVGTYEKMSEEEEEIYEVINIHKVKSFMPNLRVVNLYGIAFVDDSHVEALSGNCAHLEVLAVSYCNKFRGSSLKTLMQRCKKIKTLLMQQTDLQDSYMLEVEWQKTNLWELDITSTDLSTDCLANVLTRIPGLRWLSAGQLDGFNDIVMERFLKEGNPKSLTSLDLNSSENVSEEMLFRFIKKHGIQLRGLILSGIPQLAEQFWVNTIATLKNIKILVMGVPEGCCPKMSTKIHIDQFMDCIANNCPHMERLEVRWDPDTLRFSDKSSKFIDTLRLRCQGLRSMVLSDGKYFELVKSNFERCERKSVVRATVNCTTTMVGLLANYKDLLFN